jgi:uroporphyrinogen-III synthase
MAVLVTRPSPDNDRTASALRARGFEVLLAPMLRFEPVPLRADLGRDPDHRLGQDSSHEIGALLVTSANALRAVAPPLNNPDSDKSRLKQLPLFVVGAQTAAVARELGFAKVMSADGDAAALRELIADGVKKRIFRKRDTLLYLAGEDISRDLAGELAERGFHVMTQTVYRMAQVTTLPPEVCDAFAAHGVQAVLHYSRRSAAAFVAAARSGGVEISALAVPQCCMSGSVAEVLREAGAVQVSVAARPDENELLEGLAKWI